MSKNMRNSLLVLMVVLVGCVMTSCLDNVKSDYTPQIYLSELYLNPYYVGDTLRAKDTLQLRYNKTSETYVSDTMQVGDTLMIGVIFYADGNNLVSTRIEWDSTAMKGWFYVNETIKKALSDTTTIAEGSLRFNPGYNMVSYPTYFVPQSAGAHAVKMTVETDSKYSPVSVSFSLIAR